jgi:NAD(P)-dependent dehydrogenase (short-subunit alcohol dehydrogenase family)
MGSLAGTRMLAAPVHYCASKGALKALTQAMAKELARYQIRVNCLAPGLLDEGMGRNVPETGLTEYLRHCALGRLGTLEEVARFEHPFITDFFRAREGENRLQSLATGRAN